MFAVILFEYADSGFFDADTGATHFLLFAVVLLKMYIGLRMISYSTKEKYMKIKLLFDTFVVDGDQRKMISHSISGPPSRLSASRRDTMDQDMDHIR